MPRQLAPQEYTVFEQDTQYLEAGIPVFGSRVVQWGNEFILIYHTEKLGYVLTDITDLGSATIAELAKQSEVHGMWYYLPQMIQEVIAQDAEEVANLGVTAGKAAETILGEVSKTVGTVVGNIIQPLIPTLLIVAVILGIYLIKKG